ncbi:hypothetical protein [Deinococcus navajonensis]|uniref:Uncharacterized protein n=1 Tax=Deinococcus navajonensis TaxID=309884 RepID=A0ABV8XIW2_9DEIO
MPQRNIRPAELQEAFHSFLGSRSISLQAASATDVFDAFIEFCRTVPVELGKAPDTEETLHFEAGRGTLYFERLLVVSSSVLDEEPESGDEAGDDLATDLWALDISFRGEQLAYANFPDAPHVNLRSPDYPPLDAFAAAVRANPTMQWMTSLGALAVHTVQGAVG